MKGFDSREVEVVSRMLSGPGNLLLSTPVTLSPAPNPTPIVQPPPRPLLPFY